MQRAKTEEQDAKTNHVTGAHDRHRRSGSASAKRRNVQLPEELDSRLRAAPGTSRPSSAARRRRAEREES